MEEIIIDGVNVKDCKRRIGKNSYCRYFKRLCADNNFNCIWKQQERLKAENAELKEMLSKEPKAIQAFQIAYSGLKKDNEVLWGMVKDYKTALEEIKNNCVEMLITIAEEGKPNGAIVDTIWCKNIPCCTLFELIENTQSKINEVLGAEDE